MTCSTSDMHSNYRSQTTKPEVAAQLTDKSVTDSSCRTYRIGLETAQHMNLSATWIKVASAPVVVWWRSHFQQLFELPDGVGWDSALYTLPRMSPANSQGCTTEEAPITGLCYSEPMLFLLGPCLLLLKLPACCLPRTFCICCLCIPWVKQGSAPMHQGPLLRL